MKRSSGGAPRSNRGVTLVELLIAIAIFSLGILVTVSSYRYITTSVQHSKGRTLANNLGQEQVEKLKNLTYYNLLVTTHTATDSRFTPSILYDTGNYPAQTLIEGGMEFTRATRVDFAYQQGSQISTTAWTSDDTGLKQITVYVMWFEDGVWKENETHNLMANPKAVPLTGTFSGTVHDNAFHTIPGSLVQVVGNTNWYTYADSLGNYNFKVSPGSYTLVASSQGYFSQTSSYLSIASNGSTTFNFTLPPMSSGTVSGAVYRQDHVVISAVADATDTAGGYNTEYVELYNPTPNPINMGLGDPTQPSYWSNWRSYFYYYDRSGTGSFSYLTYISTFIPSNSYYLIANTTTVHVAGQVRQADAIYSGPSYSYTNGTSGQNFLAPMQMMTPSDAGGIVLWINYPTSGWQHDAVGWSHSGASVNCPAVAMEDYCVPNVQGIGPDEVIWRKPDPSNINLAYGRCYDTDDNSQDWVDYHTPIPAAPNNTTVGSAPCLSGAPATGASVNLNDPLSVIGTCQGTILTPNHPAAYCAFSIPGVATGTWTMNMTSSDTFGSYFAQYNNVIVQANISTGVPNGITSPAWTVVGATTSFLNATTTYAFVSGYVYDSNGHPLLHIKVTDGGTAVAFTNTSGHYFLTDSSGTVTLIANPNDTSMNRAYVTQTLLPETLTAGQLYDGSSWSGTGSNFYLSLGGAIRGYFQTSSGMALPGQVAVAVDGSGTQVAQAASDNTGYFYLTNLTTGTYTVQPSIDPAEYASPASVSVTLASTGTATSVSTFTVSNAMAEITGQALVAASSAPITTGVLVLASTATFSGSLPPSLSGANGALCAPCVYGGSSDATGDYSLQVRSSTTPYQLYGWYAKFSGSSTPTISKVGPYTVNVSSGGTIVTQNLSW